MAACGRASCILKQNLPGGAEAGENHGSILPLFSNIPYVEGNGWDGLLEPLVTKVCGKAC